MTPPIEFVHVPSRHKPARTTRALLFWLATCAVAMGSAAMMVIYAL